MLNVIFWQCTLRLESRAQLFKIVNHFFLSKLPLNTSTIQHAHSPFLGVWQFYPLKEYTRTTVQSSRFQSIFFGNVSPDLWVTPLTSKSHVWRKYFLWFFFYLTAIRKQPSPWSNILQKYTLIIYMHRVPWRWGGGVGMTLIGYNQTAGSIFSPSCLCLWDMTVIRAY